MLNLNFEQKNILYQDHKDFEWPCESFLIGHACNTTRSFWFSRLESNRHRKDFEIVEHSS
jgi:hypothetical protein